MAALVIVLITIFSFFTAIISAVTGMGGGIVLLSLMTFFLPIQIIIPIHGMVQLVSNSSRSFFLFKHIKPPIFWYYLLGLPVGVAISTFFISQLTSPQFALILIALLIFYTLFKPKKMPSLKIPFWAFSLLGLVSGMLAILIGATGPLLAPFFLRDDLDRHQIIATKSSIQLVTHLLKIPAFLYLGFNYREFALPIFLFSLAALLGTRFGIYLLGRLDESLFNKIFKVALFLAAVRLILKAVGT